MEASGGNIYLFNKKKKQSYEWLFASDTSRQPYKCEKHITF